MREWIQFIQAAELKKILVKENEEPLVCLEENRAGILCRPRRETLTKILVRQSVASKLRAVQRKLKEKIPHRQLVIVEGYRHPFVQEHEFLHYFLMLGRQHPSMEITELEEKVHQWVALPSVAGHPTGGAVDVTFADHGQEIEMGSAIADFSRTDSLSTYTQAVSSTQQEDRRLLHDLMLEVGFAPFYGEWWHFSFGDREWATFYSQRQSVYGPLYVNGFA